ncbi:hypothetical protein RR46_04107 [Papilio xuthus]|uniref:Uncharacterized protein n=1 Tax=Papilio xuthus TaxID=66420 RepID=A0A194QNC8_PAPXU|nr:hypothetical protein RR46_04107 [Papilio xuthus]
MGAGRRARPTVTFCRPAHVADLRGARFKETTHAFLRPQLVPGITWVILA